MIDKNMLLLVYIIMSLFALLFDFITFKIGQIYFAKKCNYNCAKCKNWACNKYQCLKYSNFNVKDEIGEKNER